MDDLEQIRRGNDSSVAILAEAFARGHSVDLCVGEDLSLVHGAPMSVVRAVLEITPDETFVFGGGRPEPLASYDIILMRKNPPVDRQYYFQTLLLERARGDCLIVNDPRALREINEKLAVLDFPEFIPRSRVTRSIDDLREFLEECGGDIVVKPLGGHSGRGVLRVRSTDVNRDALLELATGNGTRLTMAQSYAPGAELGDKRVVILDGEPIGSLIRRPAPGALRGNTSAGATLEAGPLTDGDELICRVVGQRLRARGIFLAGIDLVGGLLTEINVTSPSGLVGIRQVTGERPERLVVDWLERTSALHADGNPAVPSVEPQV